MVDIVVEDEQWMKLGEDGTQSHVQGRATPADLYKRMTAGPLGTGPMGRPCGDLTQALRKDVVSDFKNRMAELGGCVLSVDAQNTTTQLSHPRSCQIPPTLRCKVN